MAFSVVDKNVTVIGGGRSGVAAAELLVARGARVTLADAARAIEGSDAIAQLGVTLALGPHRHDQFVGADLLVLSPGVPTDQEPIRAARRAGVPVIGEVELASRWLTGRIVAITGTKGKSTTTTLTARMLCEAGFDATAGGNLGQPLSRQVAASRPESLHVVEVSSFQLEGTDTFHPWIAVFLNLSPDHLDRHASFDEYASAKARIFANQTADDWAVVNADDRGAMAAAAAGRARRCDYGLEATLRDGVTVEGDAIVRREAGVAAPLLPLASVRLPGRHLLSDVLAAAAVACLAGVPPAAMQRAVEGFSGLEHALERIGDIKGVSFINDSKATNIDSARKAIESFDRDLVVILGGRFKGGRFEDLRDDLTARARAVIAIGEAAPLIHEALRGAVPVHHASSMEDAVGLGYVAAAPNGTVLLAPACSSFDMFRDYADRGRAFKNAVGRLRRGEQ